MKTVEIIILMNVSLETGENMSKKFTFFLCLKHLATKRALYFSTIPSCLNLFLKIYLHPINLQAEGKSTKYQILLDSKESILSLMICSQRSASNKDMTSLILVRSSSMLST